MPRWCRCFANRIRRVPKDPSSAISSSTVLPPPVDEACLCRHSMEGEVVDEACLCRHSWRGGSVPSPSSRRSHGLHHSVPPAKLTAHCAIALLPPPSDSSCNGMPTERRSREI
ncbi:hypothetical protein PAHAL_3G244800 [Panicum hallii]|uniref:Uncharacterized protein n=1 Tax=Panicum hallii TaxID=206008 RepID=A0A2S3HB79_9POAL|nr:hypothetical protein PAHAL_3G244800 [Panicum hallii]